MLPKNGYKNWALSLPFSVASIALPWTDSKYTQKCMKKEKWQSVYNADFCRELVTDDGHGKSEQIGRRSDDALYHFHCLSMTGRFTGQTFNW